MAEPAQPHQASIPGLIQAAERLPAVPSTLRIPLAGRALGDRLYPHMALQDRHAAATLEAIGDDGSRWLHDRHSIWGTMVRTRFLRERAWRFMQQHPRAHIVNIGCGLSQYFQWLDNGTTRMTDADLAQVLALRQILLPPLNARQRMYEADVTATDWWQQLHLPRRQGQPLFLMMEGVSMYLQQEQVHHVLHTVGCNAPAGSVLVLDAFSCLAVGCEVCHRSLQHTGARVVWGLQDAGELPRTHDRLQVVETFDIMAGFDWASAWGMAGFALWTGVPYYAMYVLQVA